MSDVVTIKVAVNYKAWETPSHAVIALPPQPKQAGVQALPTIPVEELEPSALDALAKQWLDHLYAGVGRASPFKLVGE